MSLDLSIGEWLLAAVALYPVLTAAMWIAGGILFRLTDERPEQIPEIDWPGVTILIPAYNEEAVIATSLHWALASEYPAFEVLVLDDGSTDRTQEVAERAAAQEPNGYRCRVLRDDVNRGKADQLNNGFRQATYDLIVVTDADAHMHPHALRHLASRIMRSPTVAAVAGGPHVTNRTRLMAAMQVFEAAAVISLIRRTQSLTGRVGTVAGVLGMFRRDRVLEVGGYDPKMATEDIELTWRLLLAGWHTAYEPRALIGMEVPTTLSGLWAQRKRWSRGQGEVVHKHLRTVLHWRNHRMWLICFESLASLAWIILLVLSLLIAAFQLTLGGESVSVFGFSLAWGVAISVVATVQLVVSEALRHRYDRYDWRLFAIAAIYPIAFWMISAASALRSQLVALWVGPRDRRVVWDIPREQVAPAPRAQVSPARAAPAPYPDAAREP